MTGEGTELLLAGFREAALQPQAQDRFALAVSRAGVARGLAWMGQAEPAIALISELVAPLDLATGASPNYSFIPCAAAETLWLLDRTDHIDTVERNLREKVIQPDLRRINVDGRLSLARPCALRGRYDEAARWFAEARVVLEEDGAMPLRAIADYDEALMYMRRGEAGDRERAAPLIDASLAQMREIGMAGWILRAEQLEASSSSQMA
jgi:tetratricopeptide (TPR) repeat protein